MGLPGPLVLTLYHHVPQRLDMELWNLTFAVGFQLCFISVLFYFPIPPFWNVTFEKFLQKFIAKSCLESQKRLGLLNSAGAVETLRRGMWHFQLCARQLYHVRQNY